MVYIHLQFIDIYIHMILHVTICRTVSITTNMYIYILYIYTYEIICIYIYIIYIGIAQLFCDPSKITAPRAFHRGLDVQGVGLHSQRCRDLAEFLGFFRSGPQKMGEKQRKTWETTGKTWNNTGEDGRFV